MNLGLKLNLNKGNKSSRKLNWASAGIVWNKFRTILFFILLVVSIAAGGIIWQKSLSGAGWSAQRKQDFMDSQDKNVEFKQQAYLKLVDQIKEREEENSKDYQPVKNIFSPY